MAAARLGLLVLGAEEGVVGTAPADPAGTALLPAGGKMAPAGTPVAAGSALMLLLLLLKLLLLVSIATAAAVAATASEAPRTKEKKTTEHLLRACVRVYGVWCVWRGVSKFLWREGVVLVVGQGLVSKETKGRHLGLGE